MLEKCAFFNWSGGKDSMLAYHYAFIKNELDIGCFVTSISTEFDRVSMHGLRASLLRKQVACLNQSLYEIRMPTMPDMEIYSEVMNQHLQFLKNEGYDYSCYGDIFLEDLRQYREQQLASHNISGIFPIWKRNTKSLISEFIDLGYKTIVVCAKEELSEFCGRVIDHDFIKDLPAAIDPCGEHGEFHTFVFDGPLFSSPVKFSVGEKVIREFPAPKSEQGVGDSVKALGFCYLDLIDE